MTQASTKTCPMCGEEILAVALKCKHCGEDLAAPARRADRAARVARAARWRPPRWVYLVIGFGVLVAVAYKPVRTLLIERAMWAEWRGSYAVCEQVASGQLPPGSPVEQICNIAHQMAGADLRAFATHQTPRYGIESYHKEFYGDYLSNQDIAMWFGRSRLGLIMCYESKVILQEVNAALSREQICEVSHAIQRRPGFGDSHR